MISTDFLGFNEHFCIVFTFQKQVVTVGNKVSLLEFWYKIFVTEDGNTKKAFYLSTSHIRSHVKHMSSYFLQMSLHGELSRERIKKYLTRELNVIAMCSRYMKLANVIFQCQKYGTQFLKKFPKTFVVMLRQKIFLDRMQIGSCEATI